MPTLHVRPSGPLRGRLRLPGDHAVGQRLLVLAALAEGQSELRGLHAIRHMDMIAALGELGVEVSSAGEGVCVQGVGLAGLRAPAGALAANHGSSLALLASLLAPQQFGTRIVAEGAADEALVDSVVATLRSRGAQIAGTDRGDGSLGAPIAVAPLVSGEMLAAAEFAIPAGDEDAKAAMLISGLFVRGVTAVSEGMISPDHLERALLAIGVPLESMGSMVLMDLSGAAPRWPGFLWDVPADPALCGCVAAAAGAIEGSEVVFDSLLLNRTRTGLLDVLRQSGADLALAPRGDTEGGEPWGHLRIRPRALRGMLVGGELAFRMLTELPALCVWAAGAEGRTRVRDLPRAVMPRVRRLAGALRTLGVECTDYDDGMDIDGGRGSGGASFDCENDPMVALAAVCLALGGEHAVTLERVGPLSALYPDLIASLGALGAELSEEN